MRNHSLISVTKMCDAGCKAVFSQNKCSIIHNGTIIMKGHKNKRKGLWYIPIQQSLQETPFLIYNNSDTHSTHTGNSVYHTTTLTKTIEYIHQFFFHQRLILSAKQSAMTNSSAFHKSPLHKYTSTYPNQPQWQKDIFDESTTKIRQSKTQAIEHDFCLKIDADVEFELFIGATIAEQNDGTIYTDQTGAFPVTSYHRNKYRFVAYEYRSNAILVRALKDQTDKLLTAAFRDVYEYLTERGFQPKLNVMDNQCSKASTHSLGPQRTKNIHGKIMSLNPGTLARPKTTIPTIVFSFLPQKVTVYLGPQNSSQNTQKCQPSNPGTRRLAA
eukprot:CCRYP_003376-RA/>CCRYP_003376-RA protein AED:0.38 eAED:0.60 QI:0/0/0/1/0/0/3/0/327